MKARIGGLVLLAALLPGVPFAAARYGESLIDYNFRQNTFGVGFAYGDF
jgi:hypothetical protein